MGEMHGESQYGEILGSWRGLTRNYSTVNSVLATFGSDEEIEGLEEYPALREDSSSEEDGDRSCDFYDWFMERVGAPADLTSVLVFVVFNALAYALDESMWDSKVNFSSLLVMTNLASLAVSGTVTFAKFGPAVARSVNLHILWRFGTAALLFQMAQRIILDAYKAGTRPIVVKTLGYIYMPLSAVASWVIFRRGHGRLEWLALSIMTLAISAFCLLRERCREGKCEGSAFGEAWPSGFGVGLVITGVVLSCTASLTCERIYKDRSFGLRLLRTDMNYYPKHKMYLDFCGLLVALFVWCCPIQIKKSVWGIPYSTSWFGEWTAPCYLYILVQVVNWWFAGLVARRFSTVTKALVQTVATALVIVLEDPLLSIRKFSQVVIPYLCMFSIIILSALIYQTGRINLVIASASFAADKVVRITDGLRQALKEVFVLHKKKQAKDRLQADSPPLSFKDLFFKYIIIVLYTLADATRTELYTVSVGQSMITPQSFSVAMNACMLGLSVVLLFTKPPEGQRRLDALKEAVQWRKLLKFMPVGFFFALTSALMSLAMGMGMSGAMAVVIGKIYLPICALTSRWLLGKFYMWLEWFAIIILTLDSAAFGFLKNMGAGGRSTSEWAIIACALSATSSAMSAIFMEKLMKSEPGKPFMMQKLRSDFACLLWSLAFLPIMGCLADPKTFAKGAYWNYRPATEKCNKLGACGSWGEGGVFSPWDGGGAFAYSGDNNTFTSVSSAAACLCTKGVFACWNDIMIYLMLVVAVFYGFITGLVVTNFGGVIRAIADNFSLLLVYTIGDPLINGTHLNDMSLNLTALILPLSSQTFSEAAEELQKIQKIKDEHKQHGDSDCENGDEDGDTEEGHSVAEGCLAAESDSDTDDE